MMAFSFRVGTNWCHDFPKLARESGFYFNMHAARVRVDWNRISSIDIDRVIRERDFQIVDENVNNVIDYYLESEYDVKILDPNFVKLFRLAQLAVEYLLYCKQYLDQSVVILKEELKYKIEENIKLKEDTAQIQDNLKEIKEKFKEHKFTEIKSDVHGEIHKCPWCPKTFISASFANAHLIRRHSNLSQVLSDSPTVNEEYRTETEKLHNEIKTLKERLNQTEQVIRNESNKIISQNEISKKERMFGSLEDSMSLYEDQYKKYQEEMSDLKTLLFTEIRNIKRNENNLNQHDNETNHENIKVLINQQENEIQRLKIKLQEQLTSNTNEVEIKLVKQEEYWKSKIEQLENQYRNDIENLFSQLKSTQESSIHTKSEYEVKVSFLEKQSIDQSKLLAAQSEQLKNLTKDIQNNQNKKSLENETEIKLVNKQRIENIAEDTIDSESSQNLRKPFKNRILQNEKQFISNLKSHQSYYRLLRNKKTYNSLQLKSHEELETEYNLSKHKEKKPEKDLHHRKTTKGGKTYSFLNESEGSENTSTELETEFEEETVEETSENYEATHTDSTNDESYLEVDKMIQQSNHYKIRSSSQSMKIIKEELQEAFNHRLKDLGIDPEWSTIPVATFREKLESIRHHQNILSKKFPKYKQIRKKLLEEIYRRISVNQISPKCFELEKKSFLNKAMKNVKFKALKALHEFKVHKSNDISTSARRRLSLELLPKKPTQLDIQEMKRKAKLESVRLQKKDQSVTKLKSNFYNEENVQQPVIETVVEPTKHSKRSYQNIEEFMRDIEETSKLDTITTKLISTPTKTVKSIFQDSCVVINDNQSMKHDTTWALASPRNNKSVLKSTNWPVGNLVKKKVLFDLEKENSSNKKSTEIKSIEKFIQEEYDEKKELSDNSRNISSFLEEKERLTVTEKNASTENIHLKTSQSEKIAEISRKVEEKLETSRQKPIKSIETMFSAKTFSIGNEKIEIINNNQNSMNIMNSISISPTTQIETKVRSNITQLPRPAPRKQLFETKDFDLNMNIDELLTIY